MTVPEVSAVVVTWNSARDIERCLESLLAQTTPLRRIVVVDNASSDGTPDLVAARFLEVTLIRLPQNEGFAKGNNIGISHAVGDWILLLNPDATLELDWIEICLQFASDKSKIGMLGGVLWRLGEDSPERTVLDSTGIEIFKSRRVRDIGSGGDPSLVPDQPIRVFGICAAAVLLNRKMIAQTSFNGEVFAERFFCYYEDADLAWRAWRAGWEAWTLPAAEGFHRRGGSPVGAKFSRYLTHRNRLWLILRNDRPGSIFLALPQIFVHELLMFARLLRYPYLWKAVWEAVLGIPVSLRERRLLMSTDRLPIPFRKGIGFSSSDRNEALKRSVGRK